MNFIWLTIDDIATSVLHENLDLLCSRQSAAEIWTSCMEEVCFNERCGKTESLKYCGRCNIAKYCSIDCQVSLWVTVDSKDISLKSSIVVTLNIACQTAAKQNVILSMNSLPT